MSKDCGCGGSCCETKSHPKLRKLIKEILSEIHINTPGIKTFEINFWYRNREGDMDSHTEQIKALNKEEAIAELKTLFSGVRNDRMTIKEI